MTAGLYALRDAPPDDLIVAEFGAVRFMPIPASSVSRRILGAKGLLVGWALREASGVVPGTSADTVTPVAQPAAGAEFSFALAAAARLKTLAFQFVTDATVSNRALAVQILVGGAIVWQLKPGGAIVASSTIFDSFQLTAGNQGVSPQQAWSLPDIVLPAGAVIQSSTTGKGPADQFSNIVFSTQAVNAGASFDLIDGQDGSGQELAGVGMVAGGSSVQSFGEGGLPFDSGLFLNVASGIVQGAVWFRLAA